MPKINFDFSWNISSIISVLTLVAAIVGFGWNLSSNQKVQAAEFATVKQQIIDVKGEVGELRRLHLAVADTVNTQGQSIDTVTRVAQTNTKKIETTAAVLKSIPETVATIVKTQTPVVQPPVLIVASPEKEEVKKKIPH